MSKIFASSLLAVATIAAQPAQSAVVISGIELETGSFGSGQGVHGTGGKQSGTTVTGFVNNVAVNEGVSFKSSDGLSITGGGQATIESDEKNGTFSTLLVEFEQAWEKITFSLAGETGGTFNLLVNGTTLFDSNNCDICVLGSGETKFTISSVGIDSLDFSFNPALSTAKQFRVEGVAQLPVPEPTTWAMMIAGLAFAGAMLRRRVRAVQFS